MSTPPAITGGPHMNDIHTHASGGPISAAYSTHGPLPPIVNSTSQRQARSAMSNTSYRSPPISSSSQHAPSHSEYHSPPQSSPYATYPTVPQAYHSSNSQGPVLPPFSSIQAMGAIGAQQSNTSSVRYNAENGVPQRHPHSRPHNASSVSSSKRHAPGSSNVTSADSSDIEDDENGELPASGLVAPWEVLRGLADVAIERAAKARVPLPCVASRVLNVLS